MSATELTPKAFDRLAPSRQDKLWGAPSIGRHLGVSEETVRKWAKEDGIPIYAPRRGTYFASRTELDRWLRQKPNE